MSRETDDDRLWGIVAATVRPLSGRGPQPPAPSIGTPSIGAPRLANPPHHSTMAGARLPAMSRSAREASAPTRVIEPGRRRRLTTGREQLGGRIDLHGMTQDEARAVMTAFILRAARAGRRSILVITGKGTLGDGVLRRRAPEWLSEPPLRAVVAGLSEAHRRHGGAGALYVALKHQSPG